MILKDFYPRNNYKGVPPKRRFQFLQVKSRSGKKIKILNIIERRLKFEAFKVAWLPVISEMSCWACQQAAEHWHHIIPISKGGYDGYKNLLPLCISCHKRVHRFYKVRNNRQPQRDKLYKSAFVKPKIELIYVPPKNNLSNVFYDLSINM